MNQFNQFVFGIALGMGQLNPPRRCLPFQVLDDLVQALLAINRWLAAAQQIQIGSIEDQNTAHDVDLMTEFERKHILPQAWDEVQQTTV
jgi:hypothetical protein